MKNLILYYNPLTMEKTEITKEEYDKLDDCIKQECCDVLNLYKEQVGSLKDIIISADKIIQRHECCYFDTNDYNPDTDYDNIFNHVDIKDIIKQGFFILDISANDDFKYLMAHFDALEKLEENDLKIKIKSISIKLY